MPVQIDSTSAIASSSTSSNRVVALGLGLRQDLGAAFEQFLLLVAQLAGRLEVLRLDGLLLALGDIGQLGLDLLEIGRGRHALDAQARTGLGR